MPDLGSLQAPPYYIYLILGVVLLLAAVIWTCTGKVLTRFHGWVYRAKEPRRFWWEVAIYYLSGVAFIGLYFYAVT